MSDLSRRIFQKQDPRKIRTLFEHLISEKLMTENIFERTASLIRKKKFENALVVTGFPKGRTFETDGPIGSFVLADLLSNDLKIPKVAIIVPPTMKVQISPLCKKILPCVNLGSIKDVRINNMETTLAISIEFPGPNKKGVFHHMNGKILDPSFLLIKNPNTFLMNFWYGIEKQNPDSLTIGIGDGGNELGLGNFEQQIQKIIPFGKKCSCLCKAGIASSISSSIVLLGNTSNWAAFALASALDYDFSYSIYHLWLLELNKLGIVDGVTGKISPTVDGIDPLVDKAIIAELFQ